MNNCDHLCLNCMGRYICLDAQINGLNSTCAEWKPRTTKVKPRRICDFCERSKSVLGGLGRYSMTMGHIVSIGAKNTMSITSTTLAVTKKGAAIEDEKFLIKYCPLCGRKLDGEGEK